MAAFSNNVEGGSEVAVKFRVEEGILDAEICVNGDITNADAYDCTAQILASEETATCQSETCQLTAGGLPAMELFVVEKFGPGDPECTNPGQTGWLNVDIPQYAGCVRITVPNGEFDGFLADFGASYGTVGACFYAESGPGPLKLNNSPVGSGIDQDESMPMHIQYPEMITSNLDPNGSPAPRPTGARPSPGGAAG